MAKVEIYTKGYCPFCHHAKAVLSQKAVKFHEIAIDVHPEFTAEMLARSNGASTVPQIFIDDQHIGGCDDMLALDAQGKLDPLLAN